MLAARVAAADGVTDAGGACRSVVASAPANLFGVPGGTAAARDPQARAWPVLQFGDAPPCPVRRLEFSALVNFDGDAVDQTSPPPRAFQYSHGYEVRDRIHHLASYAMLPLFGAEAYIGQKLFNNPAQAGGGLRTSHKAIAVAIGGLFGVNSLTGVWNMFEGNNDPHAGTRRIVHGVLMLVADAGFFATALTRPNSRTAAGLTVYDAKKNQHAALAYASVSVATVGYLIMLFR
jgi:hypothetical protein